MRTAYLIAIATLAIAGTSAAHATTCKNGGTNWPHCTKPQPPTSTAPSTSTNTLSSLSDASAISEASSGATASLSGTLSAAGGSGGSMSYEEFSRSNMYVLPAPVNAAPLPSGLCPQGDSMAIGILWNLFSYSRSSTRTEMECLERVLATIKAQPTTHVIQAPALPPAPPAPACVQPKKRAPQKTAAPAADSCKVKP